MKIETNYTPPSKQLIDPPIEIKITLNTLDDIKILWTVFNTSSERIMNNAKHNSIGYITNTDNFMYKLWKPIDQIARKYNLL